MMDSKDPKFNSEMWEKLTMLLETGYDMEDKLGTLIEDLYDLKMEFRKGDVDA